MAMLVTAFVIGFVIFNLQREERRNQVNAEFLQSEAEWKAKVLEEKVKNMEAVTAADRVQVEYNSDSTQVLITLLPKQ